MAAPPIDVLIRGGKIVDGTGNPWFYGDIAIAGDRIAEVAPPGRLDAARAKGVVEAEGMMVCPGFIDIQSHSILPLMRDGRCLSKITQGVTTEIMGESWTPAPYGGRVTEDPEPEFEEPELRQWGEERRGWTRFRDWLATMVRRGVSPNIGSYLGGGTVRLYARGLERGEADPDELDTMRRLTHEAMREGAFGISYALIYPPDAFVGTDELIEVCRVVAEYGGTYIAHMRSEADRLLEAVDETLEIGRRAGVPVEVYHLKASGRANWGKMPEVIRRIEAARAEGLDVTADMYPYVAAGTGLASVFPPWIAADGRFLSNLRDLEVRSRIRRETETPSGDWEAMGSLAGPEGVMPVGFKRSEHRQYAGKRLSEIAALRGQDWIAAALDLLLAEEQNIGTVYFVMSEDNLRLQLQQPWMKISTDAGGMDPAWAAPEGPTHPRAYGTYPRVLGRYVREEGVLTLEDAVRKMSSAVADRLSLRDRGLLRTGCFADVVVFDAATVGDRATFEDPHRLSMGIRDVWVNGERVLADGRHTGALPGRIVEGPGAVNASAVS